MSIEVIFFSGFGYCTVDIDYTPDIYGCMYYGYGGIRPSGDGRGTYGHNVDTPPIDPRQDVVGAYWAALADGGSVI